ncbi:MAG: PD-(D/E)XK nuclease family protein [Candidatus Peribacteria bacterium]|jgi:RecB family exonuclease|nr:PD-(D/E)XK nuclease family protein [Candidatus Peribacteria bacterium]
MAYSYSQLQTYKQCPLKYRLEKVDKIHLDLPNESLHLVLGTCVHAVLEELYQQVSDLKVPEKSALVSLFATLRERELTRITQVYEGTNPFDQELIQTFYHRGTSYIERYFDKFSPFDQAVSMKTEMSISFEMEEGIQFRGKIDRLDIRDDTMIITDYKTNKSLPTDGENTIQEQIMLYSMGVEKIYGKQISQLFGRVVYLHLQKVFEREITTDKLLPIKEKYLALMQEIEKKKTDYTTGDENAFPPCPNIFCEHCSFVQLCPLFKHKYMADEMVNIEDLGEVSIKKLIEKYAIVQEKFKRYEGEKELLKEELISYAQAKGLKKLYGDTKKLSLQEMVSYTPLADQKQQLEQKLADLNLLDEVKDIDRYKLGKKFKDQSLDYTEFKDLVGKKETLFVSRVSDLKEDEMGLEVSGAE